MAELGAKAHYSRVMKTATFLKPLAASALTAAAIYGALHLRREVRRRRAAAAPESERRDWRASMPKERLDEELEQTFPASDPLPPRHVD
jgi:hypothetical protein